MDIKVKVRAKAQNRLALGIVRAYVAMHPEVTLDELNATFPHGINPDSGVKENFIDVTKVHEKQGANWNGYFVKDSELVKLADGVRMAVVSMWTKPSLERLLGKAAEFGIQAEQVGFLPEQAWMLPGESEPVPSKRVGYIIEFANSTGPVNIPNDQIATEAECSLPQKEPLVDDLHETSDGDSLVNEVSQDIRNFLKQKEEHPSVEMKNIFFNEFDLQMHLSIYLTQLEDGHGNRKYDDVDIEYFIPIEEMKKEDYDWGNKNGVNIDIVVEKNNEFVPIELKYPTDTVAFDVKRFGELVSKSREIIKHQGASNLVKYNFWKDVRRIEVLKERFKNVKNGITLFLTNDPSYLKEPRDSAAYMAFSMSNGKHGKEKHWQGESAASKSMPDFEVSKEYIISWEKVILDGVEYHYNLIEI